MIKTVWTLFLISSLLAAFGCGGASSDNDGAAPKTAAAAALKEAEEPPPSASAAAVSEETSNARKPIESEPPTKTAPKSTEADVTKLPRIEIENSPSPKAAAATESEKKITAKAASLKGKTKVDDRLENVSRRVGEMVNTHRDALKKEQKRLREGLDKIINEAAINHKLP